MPVPIDPNWPVSEPALWANWPAALKPHWPVVLGQDANSWQEHWAQFWERMTVDEKETFRSIEANMIAEANRSSSHLYGDKFAWIKQTEWDKWLTMPPGSRLAVYKWISDGSGGAVPEVLGNTSNKIYYAPGPIFTAAVNGDETDVKRVYRSISALSGLVGSAETRIKLEQSQQQQNPGTTTGGNSNTGTGSTNTGGGGSNIVPGGTTTLPDPVPTTTAKSGGSWIWLVLLALLGMGDKRRGR